MSKYSFSFLIIFLAAIAFYLAFIFSMLLLTIFAWFLLVLEIPSIIIDSIGSSLEISKYNCQGLKKGGRLIGYVERALIFFAFLLVYFSLNKNYFAILNLLPWIIAGKGLFRFGSGREGVDVRACAEWYILGTFMSILLGAFMSWLLFALILR